jgi:hypothetical protein
MSLDDAQKPEFEEWLYWSKVAIDRLSTCVDVYSKPPHEDIFASEKDRLHRQRRNGETISLLMRFHALLDQTETPSDSLTELDHHAERVIDGLALLYREALQQLPEISKDMQKLLKTPWHTKSGDRIIDELFFGPMGNEPEGLGSGLPEDGRLPGVLARMLESEQSGDNRAPRHEVLGTPQRAGHSSRHTERTSNILRSAGRMID